MVLIRKSKVIGPCPVSVPVAPGRVQRVEASMDGGTLVLFNVHNFELPVAKVNEIGKKLKDDFMGGAPLQGLQGAHGWR